MRSLKFIPWRSLLEVSALTNLVVILVELLLSLGYDGSAVVRESLSSLYAPPLGTIVIVAIGIGVGALAVYLLERLYRRRVVINASTLWALAPCLGLMILVKSLLPIPFSLIDFNEIQGISAIVGIFLQGRPYWRW
jgi:hypothetical protein